MGDKKQKKNGFSGSVGFILAAAGSAVGLGNIWRFPYLAAKGGGGIFIITYIILAFTFGYAVLATELAIGRRTKKSSIQAYKELSEKWKFVGYLAFIIPAIIITYYIIIGGWIIKYLVQYITFQGSAATQDGFFTSFITSPVSPIFFMLVFLALTAFIVFRGVDKGVEKFSVYVMPGLFVLIILIAIYSITLKYDDGGVVRTGLQGLKYYLVPDFKGLTLGSYMEILFLALGQLFYSLSVAMGIMITYGSYVSDDTDMQSSIVKIEFFDTFVAILAGMMIVPAVYVFFGLEGMSSGPGLIFISLPKIFEGMGFIGNIFGILFFAMVSFAALTSSISILETLVANGMEITKAPRRKVCLVITIISAVLGIVICLGYSLFYFDVTLPNGIVGQLLDIADYISNNVLMPIVAICTCIIIGWIVGPKWVIDELEKNSKPCRRKVLYTVMVKFIAPVLLVILLLQSLGLF